MATTNAPKPPSRVPGGAPPDGDGIALGDGPVRVDAYIDFLCPFCKLFEEQNCAALDELTGRGLITLIYHPLGFLDRLSTTRYSTRAAAASGCASDGDRFREYRDALYDAQPPEGGSGLSDDELVRLGIQTGLGDSFGGCLLKGAYLPWADYMSALAIARGVNGTPSVHVDGVGVPASAEAIAAIAIRGPA
jgi:protein-disulfide isomerase